MSVYKILALKTFLAMFLISQVMAGDVNEEEHIAPGLRAMKHCERIKIQEERAAEQTTEKQETANNEIALNLSDKFAKAVIPQAAFPKASVYYTTHPGAFYNPVVISILGDSVQLQDGSIWNIAIGDTYKTLNWLTSDTVVLTPNQDWFSSYMFRMTNQDTGVSVKCNMMLGPIYNGLYTHWIYAIDYVNKEVYLEDGSRWHITWWDASTFNKWLPNDTIMIGVNDGSRSSEFPNILINVNTLSYSRSICVQ